MNTFFEALQLFLLGIRPVLLGPLILLHSLKLGERLNAVWHAVPIVILEQQPQRRFFLQSKVFTA